MALTTGNFLRLKFVAMNCIVLIEVALFFFLFDKRSGLVEPIIQVEYWQSSRPQPVIPHWQRVSRSLYLGPSETYARYTGHCSYTSCARSVEAAKGIASKSSGEHGQGPKMISLLLWSTFGLLCHRLSGPHWRCLLSLSSSCYFQMSCFVLSFEMQQALCGYKKNLNLRRLASGSFWLTSNVFIFKGTKWRF